MNSQPEPQTSAGRLVELSGWIDVAAGSVLIGVAWLSHLPLPLAFTGTLIAIWGAGYVVAGCRNMDVVAPIILFAWLPIPLVFFLLSWTGTLSRPIGWTSLAAVLALHMAILRRVRPPNFHPGITGFFFGIGSALRDSRIFHPDGTIISGNCIPLESAPLNLRTIAQHLEGQVVLRVGSGISSRLAVQRLRLLNAPNIAMRFTSPDGAQHFDLLTLSAGTRIRDLVFGFALFRTNQFDYFRNRYGAWVPYRTPQQGAQVYFRLDPVTEPDFSPTDMAGREAALRDAVSNASRPPIFHVAVRLAEEKADKWIPVAQFSLDKLEPDFEQEGFHFKPFEGRGFEPRNGFVTRSRRWAYPASYAARPHSKAERVRRRSLSLGARLARYINTPIDNRAVGSDPAK